MEDKNILLKRSIALLGGTRVEFDHYVKHYGNVDEFYTHVTKREDLVGKKFHDYMSIWVVEPRLIQEVESRFFRW